LYPSTSITKHFALVPSANLCHIAFHVMENINQT
jgi:hypothetical protein